MGPPTPDAPRLLVRPHGPASREALWECLGALRTAGPLTPVTVAEFVSDSPFHCHE